MDRVYVVFGASGEYSDASAWPVRAFETEADARAFAAECEAAAKARPERPQWGRQPETVYRNESDLWETRIAAFVAACPDDGMPHRDDVDYSVSTVPFGLDSTALATAPPRLSQRARSYDLTSDHEP